MIDTIGIYTERFEHKGDYLEGFKILQNIDGRTGEVISQKKVYNDEVLNITEKTGGLFVHFSIPKLYGLDNNFYSLGVGSYKSTEKILLKKLNSLGYEVDLKDFKIGRLDIFKNIELENDFGSYGFIFDYLNYKRTHKRDYIDGFLFTNYNREICFYNKTKEIEMKGGIIPIGVVRDRIMRGEVRLLNHKTISKYDLGEYLGIPDNWEKVKSIYQEHMREVFNIDFSGIDDDRLARENLLERVGFDKAFELFGLFGFVGIRREKIKEAFIKKGYSERTFYRFIRKIKEVENTIDYIKIEGSKKMFYEVKNKFLKSA